MILRFTDEPHDIEKGVVFFALSDLKNKMLLPYVVTTEWHCIEVQLTDKTPKGILRQLITQKIVRPIFDKENITYPVMQLLCELLPDRAAQLRVSFKQDKAEFMRLVNEVCERRGW